MSMPARTQPKADRTDLTDLITTTDPNHIEVSFCLLSPHRSKRGDVDLDGAAMLLPSAAVSKRVSIESPKLKETPSVALALSPAALLELRPHLSPSTPHRSRLHLLEMLIIPRHDRCPCLLRHLLTQLLG